MWETRFRRSASRPHRTDGRFVVGRQWDQFVPIARRCCHEQQYEQFSFDRRSTLTMIIVQNGKKIMP